MCFIQVGTYKPKKKPRALTHKERIEENKRLAEMANEILTGDNPIGNSFKMIDKYARPKSIFDSMIEDEVRNKQMGFK